VCVRAKKSKGKTMDNLAVGIGSSSEIDSTKAGMKAAQSRDKNLLFVNKLKTRKKIQAFEKKEKLY